MGSQSQIIHLLFDELEKERINLNKVMQQLFFNPFPVLADSSSELSINNISDKTWSFEAPTFFSAF